jgi:alcohol dehydrogenase class IV
MHTLLSSLYAGMAFSNAPCAAVHALAYPIGKKECVRC